MWNRIENDNYLWDSGFLDEFIINKKYLMLAKLTPLVFYDSIRKNLVDIL
jgi:hypothetical protein